MGSDSISLIIIVFCIVMSAYFSATETAFSTLSRARVKNMAEKGNARAALVLRLSERYDSMLSTILVGNNIVNIATASLTTLIFARLLGEEAGASVSTAVTTIVVLIFGEVSPKSIAKESPEKFAMFSAPILNVLMKVLTPVNFLFAQWKKLLSRIIKSDEEKSITEDELLTIVDEAQLEGGINEQEGSLIRNAIEFKDMEAADIFTPSVDVTGIPKDATVEKTAEVFEETGYSRLPVYEGGLDNIIGIVYEKDFYSRVYRKGEELSSIIRPAMYITKFRKINELMKDLQSRKQHMAVVVDEFGVTRGIVTLEDILEELVGDIWDEHDQVETKLQRISENEYLVSGKADVEKVFEFLGKEKEFEVLTVGGWVMNELGRVPEAGASFAADGLEVRVEEMNGRRIDQVKIRRLA
ncbi:MAG TPA: hemolysin family protein [Candidatus Eisenbergiella merdigallinarum]|uniref:Hemolysin family protein n=1 Tax=Candidatus Eisenbergiella merdigallinarum TaxID=2838552 RepID=A0A9D2SCB3_9FIRM|nr:hemolysin family protein [Candidatus Eisenbergiella merdigallinarum]